MRTRFINSFSRKDNYFERETKKIKNKKIKINKIIERQFFLTISQYHKSISHVLNMTRTHNHLIGE